MSLAESDAALHTTMMNGVDILDNSYTVFKAQVGTIKVPRRNLGYHGALAREHLNACI